MSSWCIASSAAVCRRTPAWGLTGTAQVNFVIGNAVKGGLYGKPPSLTNLVLGDNLENTTDFRQVYATLIQQWMGANAATVLGQNFTTMDIFRT